MGGQFTVGTALEVEALSAAGIERADVFVASTDGDNTNIVIAQIAKRRFNVPKVIARILDPYRAKWYARAGAGHDLPDPGGDRDARASEVRERRRRGRRGPAASAPSTTRTPTSERWPSGMYIIIVGAGKVGWNLARELIEKGNEVTLIESNRERYLTVEQELEHNIQYGDASELWVLERAGISRADMVIAVTGDDEDNMLICQVAKEKYLVDRIIARVNNPRNRETLRAARDQAGGLGDRPDPAPDRARGARVRARPPARPARAAAGDHRDGAAARTRRRPGSGSATSRCPRAAC